MEKNAVSVYYPDKDQQNKVEVDLSFDGAKKGSAIGLLIASRIPHPIALPVGFVVGGLIGAVLGKPD
ncbi:hypothetical protein HJ014_04045 [Vibrio parahaemolyticus]|uniref:hypothetical protein n=1 Tax=Vibrio alginolyticus TaxID=663 RepID=UPI0000D54044|nr:hypothetical protein [Vibrio alginolyticus]EAS76773.1 hypothetical protein V12G01_07748 [Vibrio alginolyticus 12G01]EGR0746418.1 hypothetical protein [Vibrio parahaemolyticus]MBE4463881.1 hypothetical protein [Vibrio parahaemolyticus]